MHQQEAIEDDDELFFDIVTRPTFYTGDGPQPTNVPGTSSKVQPFPVPEIQAPPEHPTFVIEPPSHPVAGTPVRTGDILRKKEANINITGKSSFWQRLRRSVRDTKSSVKSLSTVSLIL